MQSIIDGLDSNDVDLAARAYRSISSLVEPYSPIALNDSSSELHRNAYELQKRLASSANRALAIICGNENGLHIKHAGALINACQRLSELTERWVQHLGTRLKS